MLNFQQIFDMTNISNDFLDWFTTIFNIIDRYIDFGISYIDRSQF